MFFGTYTRGESEGIYVSEFDSDTGELGDARLAAKIENPSFLAIHPGGEYLLAASEVSNLDGGGAVFSYKINRESGELEKISSQPSGGGGPCHISTDSQGKCCCWWRITVEVAFRPFPISSDGKIGEAGSFIQHEGRSVNPKRQREPHAHSINPGVDDRFAYAADLGCDRIFQYRLDPEKGTLQASGSVSLPPGSGPRHFAVHPSGKFCLCDQRTHFERDGFLL